MNMDITTKLAPYLKNLQDISTNAHYVILVFEDVCFMEAGYDPGDPETMRHVTTCKYYGFGDRHTWEQCVVGLNEDAIERLKSGLHPRRIVFFKSEGQRKLHITASVI